MDNHAGTKPRQEGKLNTRIESDCIGARHIDSDAYYGINAVRAAENFTISGQRCHPEMVLSIAAVKKACAEANREAGVLTEMVAKAIVAACDEILSGKLHDQFITDAFQGGAGTSFNMNANEVIANRALEILGRQKGEYSVVSPTDHVNAGQSTNDVYPSCGRITAIVLLDKLIAEYKRLESAFAAKAIEFDAVLKMGRTQLQDAVPIRLGQVFNAYATAASRAMGRLCRAKSELYALNLGGTAIGTAINAEAVYLRRVVTILAEQTGLPLTQAEDMVDATQNLDDFVSVSGALKSCAMGLSKICNDLRLMSSGPRTGISEINLPPRQPGSSIMPGKINPVIPEIVSQVAFNVAGNDVTIAMAVEGGQLELNAFEPIIFYNLFQSIDTLKNAITTLIDNCISGITANEERCRTLVDGSVGIVTALCPHIGYEKATAIAKAAIETGKPVAELILAENILSEEELKNVLNPFKMTEPAR